MTSEAVGASYPAHWEADVVLRDGSTMHIRPIAPDDADALQSFHRAQSAQSTYFRFFAPMEQLSTRDLERFTNVDHDQRVALVLVQPGEEHDQILAVGRFDRLEPDGDVAEVAFNVADAAQGRGLGSILLEHLAAAGREIGIRRFSADVLPSNSRMLRVFTDAGYDTSQELADGIVEVSVPIRPTDRSLAVLAERERRAEALSMTALLAADGVLVLARGDEGRPIGDRLLASIQESGFSGRVLSAETIAEVEDEKLPTLAMVAAPAGDVMAALPVLAARGTRAIVLLSAGFRTGSGESGPSQRSLMRALREHGLRLVGPRSFGVLAHGEAGPLPATLATAPIRQGEVGVFCQSSQAARTLLTEVAGRGIGLSSFLAAGQRADISGNDTMQYWSTDDRTTVACLYLESIGNPRKFSRVARRLAATKPVVVTIAGTTGQRQLPGHPVRSSTAPRRVVEQMMSQAGVLLARSVAQQLDWAALLSSQPLPAGDRVLVVSNSGSHAAVLGDLVVEHGLLVAGEPITLAPTIAADELRATLGEAAERDDWDMAVIGYGPFGVDISTDAAQAAAQLAADSGRTVAGLVLGRAGLHPDLAATAPDGALVRVPGFHEGADAVAALAAARGYARRRNDPDSPRVEVVGARRREARALTHGELAGVPAGTSVRLSSEKASALLAAYGLDVWRATKVADLEAARAAAAQIGWPVALKAADEVLRHRADLGGVRLDLSGDAELTEAYTSITERLDALGRHNVSLEVQAMAPTGAACVVTGVEDDLYGPIIGFGMAGDAVELLDDVAYRIPPLTEADVADLVRAVRASPRLLGHRGLPPMDVAALEDVIGRVSVLKDELPEVRSVTLNPVLVAEHGLAILSATIDLLAAERGDTARRTLP
ncbi:GNAT family N-acetyltransferase [Pseudactinotalea terrae]|uniref:GNAT family N-acetyltransferase n=1 Tax=Pseudactinotalea terrae TaxID=1743262 RepID=UPI0012E1CE07|nr:GNAT family N-acetyltransferase [Pseudactinotalea terrae]